jgi:hypothetical protein
MKWMKVDARKLSWAILVGWIYGFLAAFSLHRLDPDFGWHWRSGQYILTHGVPHHDIFSYTAPNFDWINHEWLSDVLVYVVSLWGGYQVVALVFAGLWTVALVVAARSRLSWLSVAVALPAVSVYAGVRGVTWTALGLALTLLIFERRGRYWWLPVLMLTWANLHAGFAVGLAMGVLRVAMTRDWRLARWLGLAAAATLINPYGMGVYTELWRTVSDGNLSRYIIEWMPLGVSWAVTPYLVLVGVALVWRRGSGFDLVRIGGLLMAAVWSSRHEPLLVVGSLAYAGEVLAVRWRWASAAGGILGVVAILGLLVAPYGIQVTYVSDQPWSAIRALRSDPCRDSIQ